MEFNVKVEPQKSMLFAACMMISSISAAEVESSDSSIKSTAKAAMSSVITAGKNLLGGVSEGVVDGRQTVQGADGAEIISSFAQMHERLDGRNKKGQRNALAFSVFRLAPRPGLEPGTQ